jgi:predicted esterase YcpF (UPF0227 family)
LKNKEFKVIKTIHATTHTWANTTIPIGTIVKQVSDTKNSINPMIGIVAQSDTVEGLHVIPYEFLTPLFDYKKTILLLHGFNSAPGNKEKIIKDWLHANNLTSNFNLIAPQLNNSPQEAIKQISEIIQENYGNIFVMGTSLGGFYATYIRSLNHSDAIKVYAINPSWSPGKTLSQEVNTPQKNYKTGLDWEFTESYLNDLTEFEKEAKSKLKIYEGNHYSLHLASSDEFLDFSELLAYHDEFKVPNKTFYYETNHRFEKVIEMLDNYKAELSL